MPLISSDQRAGEASSLDGNMCGEGVKVGGTLTCIGQKCTEADSLFVKHLAHNKVLDPFQGFTMTQKSIRPMLQNNFHCNSTACFPECWKKVSQTGSCDLGGLKTNSSQRTFPTQINEWKIPKENAEYRVKPALALICTCKHLLQRAGTR